VVGLDLGLRDRPNLILNRLDHLLRLLHFGDLLSLCHLGWLFSLSPKSPARFGKRTKENWGILSELSNGGLEEWKLRAAPSPTSEARLGAFGRL